MSAAAEILASKTWCVVGNLGKNPIVARLVATLQAAGKEVSSVNPSGGAFDRDFKVEQATRLVDLDPLPETLNLCINSHQGLQLITELVETPRFPAGATKNVFIQPGAESPALLDYCAAHGLRVHQGCVLIEMPRSK